MKNFYDISKGQLLTVWIFGIIGFIAAAGVASEYPDTNIPLALSIVIPFVTIFYTLGYSSQHHKK